MKKVLSVVLAMLMVVSLATPSFAASIPVAKIQTVAGTEFSSNENFDGFPFNGVNPKFVFGAEMSVDSIGSDLFADFIADFEINFSEDVKAKLYGRFAGYEDGKWIEFPGEYIDFKKGNTDLLKTFAKDWQVTVSEIDTTVKNFYCALVVDPLTIDEKEFKANVGVVIYEKDDPDFNFPVKTTGDSTTEAVVEKPAAPMARIETVAGSAFSTTAGFTDFPSAGVKTECLLGAKFAVADLGEGYEKLLADFRINFSEAVRAKLYGKIEGGKWEEFSPNYMEFNEGDVDLLTEKAGDWKVTVSDVKDIDTFYCALLVDPSTVENAFTAKLNVITYADGEYAPEKVKVVEPTVDSVVEIALPGPTMPVAEIKTIAGTDFSETDGFKDFPLSGLNEECLLGAEMSLDSKGFAFDDLIADFRINFSEDVKAKLYGKFEGENETWIEFPGGYIDFKKGDIDLLHDLNKWEVSLADVKNIGTFYCALLLDPTTVDNNFSATLDIVTYVKDNYAPEAAVPLETTTGSDKEAKLAKPEMPVATITMIPGEKFADTDVFDEFSLDGINPDCVVGAIFEGTAGKGFEKFVADFKLKVSDDVTAKLYGNYGSYGWVLFNDGPVSFEGDKDYYLLKDFGDVEVDVKTVGSIGKFYCAFVVDEDSVDSLVDVSLGTVIYEKPADEAAEPKFIDVPVTSGSVEKYSVGKVLVPPTANIKLIPGSEFKNTEGFKDFAAEIAARNLGVDIDMDYVVGCVSSVADMGKGYNKSYVEYMLTLSEEVDALFFGKYRSFDWQEASKSFTTISEGTTPMLSKLSYEGTEMTLEEASEIVGEFYCAFYIDPDTADDIVTLDFETKLFDKPHGDEPVEYIDVKVSDTSETEIKTAIVTPVANVELVPGAEFATDDIFKYFDISNVDPDYVMGARLTPTEEGKGYDNSFIDFNINVSKALKAKLFGKIDTGEWENFGTSFVDFAEGDNYLLKDSEYANVKLSECVGSTLYCVFIVDPETVDGKVNVVLEPVVCGEDGYVSLELAEGTDNKGEVAEVLTEPATRITTKNFQDFDLHPIDYIGYYAIENIAQLNWFAEFVKTNPAANAILVDDISTGVKEVDEDSIVKAWAPIGSEDVPYEGTFDGNGHIINGLFIAGEDDYVGLFGYISEFGSVQDLGLENSYFEGKKYVGGIAGCNAGAIKSSYSFAEVKGEECVGNICGYNLGVINACYFKGEVNETAIGKDEGTSTAEVKSKEQFKSGEAAYLLGEGWGQKLGYDEKPVFGGEKVYNCGELGFNNIPDLVIDKTLNVLDYSFIVNEAVSGKSDYLSCDLDGDLIVDVIDAAIYERLIHNIVD